MRWLMASIRSDPNLLSYAADWSEYFGHHPQDGSVGVFFHLDPLWADDEIDFVGIDNYMPLSDWRDEFEHRDAENADTVTDLDYLRGNVEGGEGHDWFYASADDREDQLRTPITDGAHGRPWVFRFIEQAGSTLFSCAELNDFDALLRGPWPGSHTPRPAIPRAILDHLRAECLNQCARCGSGIGIDTAHIRPWSESRSHHPGNLIRLCSSCHREHDAQQSLSTADLLALKSRLVERTRDNLAARIKNVRPLSRVRRPSASFVGRDNELVSLIVALRSGRSVILTGGGGIGKTELLIHAVHQADTGRPVFWIDVEQHRSAADILLELRTAVGWEGMASPAAALPGRLDALQACVVFDGVERATVEGLDGFEDAVTGLYSATAVAQFVLTSQVMLHGFSADVRIRVGRLDDTSSGTLLTAVRPDFDRTDLAPLLAFCEGHALTLQLAAALIDHYGGAKSTYDVIKAQGVKAVRMPGRQQHSRADSLELCFAASYEAVSAEARRLLWALAEAPAGLFTHHIDGDWLAISAPVEALAELRRWHLVDFFLWFARTFNERTCSAQFGLS